MNKKGQVYILAAVILSVTLFGLSVSRNHIVQASVDDDFGRLSEMYELESSRFMNSLLSDNPSIASQELSSEFLKFSYAFSSYARSQNPEYELVYVVKRNTELLVGNFLKTDLILKNSNGDPIDGVVTGCYAQLSATVQLGGLRVNPGIDFSTISGCGKTITSSDQEVQLCIMDNSKETCYPFTVASGKPQLMIVTGASVGDQRQVFIGGEGFVKGSSGAV